MSIDKSKLYGIDASNEVSLLEYGTIICPDTEGGATDEYFIVYRATSGNMN